MVRDFTSSLLKALIPLVLLLSQPGHAGDLSALGRAICLEDGAIAAFSGEDFPQSDMSVFRTEGSPYSMWAAEMANHAKESFEEGYSIAGVFSAVAAERRGLQIRMTGEYDSDSYGKLRGHESGTFLFKWTSQELSPTKTRLKGVISQRMNHVRGKTLGMTDVYSYGWNKYVSTHGTMIEMSRVEMDANDRVVLRHHRAPQNQVVFEDVQLRLSKLQHEPALDLESKEREFLVCLFGYFNAMPYERGSAAIGRSVFTGIYASLFHKKPPTFPDAIDVEAMVMEQDQFVTKYLPELFKSYQN